MSSLMIGSDELSVVMCSALAVSGLRRRRWCVFVVHTLAELKMTGNCLKGSRPLLSFDPKCEKEPHHALLKELFTQVYFSIISPLVLHLH
uniref:Ribosome biogenesis protein BRX1 homolog n=1 Tax=Cyprinus carpio carpio TaxID=630221 RepID=A0A9J7ZCF5_CYPCA